MGVALALSASAEVAAAATRYVAPTGSDSGACTTETAPCRTFGHAYRQSQPGDVVQMAGGSYPAQSVSSVAGRSAPPVEFRPANGGQVTVADLDINGNQVTVRGLTSSSEVSVTNVSSVKVIDTRATKIWMQNAHGVEFRGGSYGGNRDTPTVQIAGDPASSNLTFDGVDFHDAVATNSTVHMECIWVAGVDGFTVRNSIFRNCAYFDIFFTRLNGPDPKNVLLENNVFEVTKQWNGQNAPYAVNVANWLSKAENFTFRNNTFGGDIAIQPVVANMKITGNVGGVASCKSGVVYSYNVFTKAKCAGTDKQVADALSEFVNPAGHDWRLRAGAAAIDSGNPGDYPASDRDGLTRVGLPDAGAHEYNAGAPLPPDTQPPGAPGGFTASAGIEQVTLSWAAASDNVGVTRYSVHRSTSAGFVPSAANRVAYVTTTGYTDSAVAAGTHRYRVVAEDAAGNAGAASAEASAQVLPEQTPPAVSLSGPAAGATISGTVTVSASASDNRGVSGVQFKLDGANLGAEDTSAPYSTGWNTTLSSEGGHTLTAVARDAAGNTATSGARTVNVDNVPAGDSQAPSAPASFGVTGGEHKALLAWSSASDNVAVVAYNVHRALLPGAVPSGANRVGQTGGTAYADLNLLPGVYYYRVTAEDAAGNVGPASNEAAGTATAPAPPPPTTQPAPAPSSPPSKPRVRKNRRTLRQSSVGTGRSVAWSLAVVRGGKRRACVVRRGGCPRAVRLRLRSSRAGRLHVRVEKLTRGRRWRPAARRARRVRQGINVLSLSPGHWRRGSYRMVLKRQGPRAVGSEALRVRFSVRGRRGAHVLRLGH